MCELLGIAASAPVSARFSLRRLARRGRRAGEPIDGWGVVLSASTLTVTFTSAEDVRGLVVC
ncbi:MAG: class II glutamine amidotransferase [Acetobacteraceae bacterium]